MPLVVSYPGRPSHRCDPWPPHPTESVTTVMERIEARCNYSINVCLWNAQQIRLTVPQAWTAAGVAAAIAPAVYGAAFGTGAALAVQAGEKTFSSHAARALGERIIERIANRRLLTEYERKLAARAVKVTLEENRANIQAHLERGNWNEICDRINTELTNAIRALPEPERPTPGAITELTNDLRTAAFAILGGTTGAAAAGARRVAEGLYGREGAPTYRSTGEADREAGKWESEVGRYKGILREWRNWYARTSTQERRLPPTSRDWPRWPLPEPLSLRP